MFTKHLQLNSVFLAKLISLISNPFIIITLAFFIGDYDYVLNAPGELLMFISIGLFLPLIVYTYQLLQHKKHFWDFISLTQTTRNPVYLISIYCMLFNVIIFAHLGLSFWIAQSVLMFVFFGTMYLINKNIDKVSMHTAAFAFAVLYLIDKTSFAFILFLAFLPVIFWSRIKLHKHTSFQLFLGTMIGVFIGLVSWLAK